MKTLISWVFVGWFALVQIAVGFVEPVKIGAVFAKTGNAAISNLNHLPGLRMAVDEINRSGGLWGRQIEVLERQRKEIEVRDESILALSTPITFVP